MDELIFTLYEINRLKDALLFESLYDSDGFEFINNKDLNSHYSIYNDYLYFYYNTLTHTTNMIRMKLTVNPENVLIN